MKTLVCLAALLAAGTAVGQAVAPLAVDARQKTDDAALRAKSKAIRELSRTDLKAACELEAQLIAELQTRGPGHIWLPSYVHDHLRRLENVDLAAARSSAERFAASENTDVRAAADAWQNIDALRTRPMELAFTAIDGRKVDLAALRGKVVLVEFTGVTWCPACRVAEKELKHLYAKYREQGFEIVAITREGSPADRDKVLALNRERELPWPFSFDGLGHESPLIARFGVRAYPTTFVLDRTGRLAAHDPKGEALEQAVIAAL